MRDTDYAYAVARIRANEGKLLTEAQVQTLTDAPSFERAVQDLKNLGWLENDEESDISAIIARQNEQLWTLLQQVVPDKQALSALTALNDFFNLKAALKCMLTSADPTPLYQQPSVLDLPALTESVNAHAFDRLPPFFAECAKRAFEAAHRTESGQSADILIDEAALRYLAQMADTTKSALLRELFRFICDSTNIKTALRCARTGKDLSFTESAVGPCFALEKSQLCFAAVQSESALFTYLATTPLSGGAALLQKSTSAFEKWCDDMLIEQAKRAKYVFFGFDPIAAYFFAKSAEIKTVRILLSAKKSGVSPEIIKERVRALYV